MPYTLCRKRCGHCESRRPWVRLIVTLLTRCRRTARIAKRRFRKFKCCVVCFFALACCLCSRPSVDLRQSLHFADVQNCTAPTVLIAVLTMDRVLSLRRLLLSLAHARYECSPVHLTFYVDMPRQTRQHDHQVTELINNYAWPYGEKHVLLQSRNVGLASNWFSVEVDDVHDYVLILEDDMELSSYFYAFISSLHRHKILSSANITSFCLHPGDWEINIDLDCKMSSLSNILYESPEPCNWAPVWKASSWRMYMRWVVEMKLHNNKPYVPESIGYNYNIYLKKLYDVQSPWVWRYNWEHGKISMRYSFSKCNTLPREEYFATNHKEPGEHFPRRSKNKFFAQKQRLVSHKSNIEIRKIVFTTSDKLGLVVPPQRFRGYLENMFSLIPPP